MTYLTQTMKLTLVVLLVAGLTGCDPAGTSPGATSSESGGGAIAARHGQVQNTVEITATHDHATKEHGFELSSSSISSGWTTFAFDNATHADHFVLVSKVPDGIGLDDYREEVAYVAQNFLDVINGADPAGFPTGFTYPDAGFDFPAWYGDVVFMGGPGLTAPGRTSQTTMNLEAGTYILECYVKTEDAKYWHHVRGMLAELEVTDQVSGAKEPKSTIDVTLRNPENGGIDVDGRIRPGAHTIGVHFDEQMVYTTGGMNDVHLVRLRDDTNLDDLAAWMNPFLPDGMVSPGAPADFMGGIEDMPEGSTGYFTVRLTPGDYAWISEVPDPMGNNMLKTFTVPSRGR